MNPVLGIWYSSVLLPVRNAVGKILEAKGGYNDVYFDIDASSCSAENLGGELAKYYRQLVPATATLPELRIMAVLPLWDDKAVEYVATLLSAVENRHESFSVCFVGMKSTIKGISGIETPDKQKDTDRILAIARAVAESRVRCSFSPIDDYLSFGPAVNFDTNSLADFMATLTEIMLLNYNSVFAGLPLFGSSEPQCLSIGMAKVTFDRNAAVDYLVNKAFIMSLERAGVSIERIDVQGAANRSTAALKGIDSTFDEFFAHITENSDEDYNAKSAHAAAELPDKVRSLRSALLRFTEDAKLSMPEKEATLALVLGLDNDMLHGQTYQEPDLLFDDVFSKPLDIFIGIDNRRKKEDHVLPYRGDYPMLRYDDSEDLLGLRNESAFNPVGELKSLKDEIRQSTAYIRSQEKQIKDLNRLVLANTHTDDVLEADGLQVRRKLLPAVEEQPLAEKYEPKPGLKPAPSVDLRQFFSPIRDQGSVGSCSSFAMTALYEYVLNRKSGVPSASLSERFLFYHSNVVKGMAEGGSTYYDQVDVLQKYGICQEALLPYDVDILTTKPSAEAIADAATHRVVKAKQIDLLNGSDSYKNVRTNHAMLTSALSEGYPVGIALRIFDDFEKHRLGFVPRPSQAQIDVSERSYHAMVIVGYSEADKYYIVRNSWGTQFGDKGYCYIAASYVDDPELNNYACIITETTDDADASGSVVPSMVATFEQDESLIKMAALQNAVAEERLKYASLQIRYKELFRYYTDIKTKLSNPSIRKGISDANDVDLSNQIKDAEFERNNLLAEFDAKMRQFRKDKITQIVIAWCVAVVLTGVGVLFLTYGLFSWWAVAIDGLSILVALWLTIWYKYELHKFRNELQEEINRISKKIARLKAELDVSRLKLHVAGIFLDAMSELQISLTSTYNHLGAFNNNLRHWYDVEYLRKPTAEATKSALIISLAEKPLLDAFFADACVSVCDDIDFMKAFTDMDNSEQMANLDADNVAQSFEQALQKVHDDICANTVGALAKKFADFRMTDMLLDKAAYPYLTTPDFRKVFADLNRLANVLCHNTDNNPLNQSSYAFIDATDTELTAVNHTIAPYFGTRPSLCTMPERETIVLLTLRMLPIDTL